MNERTIITKHSGTLGQSFFVTTGSTTHSELAVPRRVSKSKKRDRKDLVAAVYAYIKAVRALGRTIVNSKEIANALDVSVKDVEQAAKQLKERGVKPFK